MAGWGIASRPVGWPRDPGWRGLSRYVLIAGIASVAGFVLIGALVMPDGAARPAVTPNPPTLWRSSGATGSRR